MDLPVGAGKQARLHGAGHNRDLLLRQIAPPLLGSPKIEISKMASIPNAPYALQTDLLFSTMCAPEGKEALCAIAAQTSPAFLATYLDAEAVHPTQECPRGLRSPACKYPTLLWLASKPRPGLE